MTTPILKTARLTLRAPVVYKGMDLKHHLKWLNNKHITQYSENRHSSHTEDTQFEYLEMFDGVNDLFWEVFRGNGQPIGSVNAFLSIPNRSANVGIIIGDSEVWGQGYGPEAWDAVCEWLFSQDTRKIEAGCMASNSGMIRILEKTGFTYEATIPAHFILSGKPEDKVCYGKTKKAKVIPITRGNGGRESVLGSTGEGS